MNKVLPGEQNFSERARAVQVVVSKGLVGGRKGRGKCKAGDSIKVFSPFLQNSCVGPRVGQSYLDAPMLEIFTSWEYLLKVLATLDFITKSPCTVFQSSCNYWYEKQRPASCLSRDRGWVEAEEEVESLKRKTGEIDFIQRTQGRQARQGGNGHSWRKTKNLCVARLLRTEAQGL